MTTTRAGLPILLAPFDEDEADRVWQLCQDPDVQRWTTLPSPYPPEAAEQFINEYAPAGWHSMDDGTFTCDDAGPELVWGVRLPDGSPDAGLWGSIGLRRRGSGQLEIGWWLGAPVRGRGIMRAAVAKLIEVAFSPDGPIRASEVIWRAKLGNEQSARVAQQTGFTYTGVIVDPRHEDFKVWSAGIHPGDPTEPKSGWTVLG